MKKNIEALRDRKERANIRFKMLSSGLSAILKDCELTAEGVSLVAELLTKEVAPAAEENEKAVAEYYGTFSRRRRVSRNLRAKKTANVKPSKATPHAGGKA